MSKVKVTFVMDTEKFIAGMNRASSPQMYAIGFGAAIGNIAIKGKTSLGKRDSELEQMGIEVSQRVMRDSGCSDVRVDDLE